MGYILGWIRKKLQKPVKYRVVFWGRGFMSNVVVLHEVVVTSKSQIDAYWKAIAADRELYVNKTFRYKVKWYAYKLEDQ